MKALQAYIDQKNKWAALFNGAQMELKTAKGRQRVADSLDADLSPENLTCDGELSRAEVKRRWTALASAARDLKKLDPAVKMFEFA
jgi:hypothetical protein